MSRKTAPPAASQFPSPMVENIREHNRISEETPPGTTIELTGILPKPVEVYIPKKQGNRLFTKLLIHFHGSSFIPEYAVYKAEHAVVCAAVNLGAGSSVYGRPFRDSGVFERLVKAVKKAVMETGAYDEDFQTLYLSSFSAGYGAVRAILRHHPEKVDGIILLDGLHAGYVPEGKVLFEGGKLDESNLDVFLDYARSAADGEKHFVITHSEIFPGTYASTTETADYLIESLGLDRNPVLKWGPGGMQQVSETTAGNLAILGFAGNTAPDHVDHLHGLPVFLKRLMGE